MSPCSRVSYGFWTLGYSQCFTREMGMLSSHYYDAGPFGLLADYTGNRWILGYYLFMVRFLQYSLGVMLAVLLSFGPAVSKTVVLINSYHCGYQWVRDYQAGLHEAWGKGVTLVSFDLDTKRLPPEKFPEQAAKALALIDANKPDVVILADDNALKLLCKDVVDRGYPTVFLGINGNPRVYDLRLERVVGVLERPLNKRVIVSLNDLFDDKFSKLLALFDVSTTSAVLKKQYFKAPTLKFAGYQMDLKYISTMEEWKEVVLSSKANGYQGIILGLHHTVRHEDGSHVPYREVARWTAEHSPVPLFAFWEFSVAKDMAIGGLVLDGRSQGLVAGRLAKLIMSGSSPSELQTVIADQGKLIFSRSGLKRWGLELHPHHGEDIYYVE